MVIPDKKTSIMRKNRRHGTWQRLTIKKILKATTIMKCPVCGKDKMTHRVCPVCGYYGKEQIITIKTKSKQQILEA